MKRKMIHRCMIMAFFMAFTLSAGMIRAQETLTLIGDKSTLVVSGSSTLKDWQAKAGAMSGSTRVNLESGLAIEAGQVTVEANSLDGGRGPDMNAKIYKALNVEENPQIIFVANDVTVTSQPGADEVTMIAKGTLEIAGKALPISVDLKGTTAPFTVQGTHELRFSDYDITPPSALFGTIVCDDEISIAINLVFE